MISFENVTKIYQHQGLKIKALDQLNITIKEQEIFGVIGESGSGKSTLLKMINSLESPDVGEIMIAGVSINQLTEEQQRIARKKTSMIFQQFNLLHNQTVFQNVQLPLTLAHKKSESRVSEVLHFVRMTGKAQYYPKQLSGGEKQRVAIARALISKPELLLCDEPTSALDAQHAYEIVELLQKINQTFGTTIVIVSHELEVIKQLCDRVAILENGQLLETRRLPKKQHGQLFSSYYERIKERLDE